VTERPRRGAPDETRARLVAAAAEAFNRDGYHGTDSNRIAREAGYAPGTFYKHFRDKKEIFLSVYAEWVAREWRDIGATLRAGGTRRELAARIVDVFLAHHERWRGFRASLRALAALDADIREFHRAQRRKQLALLSRLGGSTSREEDALLLFTLERAGDAVAEGEADALRLRRGAFRELLERLVLRRLGQRAR
jgi:AcrR family transcriptional regulator